MVAYLCFYATLILAVDTQVFPVILTKLGGTSIQQGLLLTSLFFFFPITSPFIGLAADRIGKKAVIIVGAACLAIPFGISAIVDVLWIRTLVVLLFGFGIGAVEVPTSALLTDIYPGRERSILNIAQIFFSLGAAGGPFIISLAYRIKPTLAITSLLLGVATITTTVVIGFLFIKDSASRIEEFDFMVFKNILSDKDGRLLLISIFFYVGSEMGTAGWLVKYSEEYLSLSSALAPISLALFWGGLGISRILVGFFILKVNDQRLLTIALLLTLTSRITAFLIKTPIGALILFSLIGLGMGTMWPTLVAMICKKFKELSGSAVGLMIAVGGFAVPIIHQVIGFLSQGNLLGLRNTLLGLGLLTLINLYIVNRVSCGCKKKDVWARFSSKSHK